MLALVSSKLQAEPVLIETVSNYSALQLPPSTADQYGMMSCISIYIVQPILNEFQHMITSVWIMLNL